VAGPVSERFLLCFRAGAADGVVSAPATGELTTTNGGGSSLFATELALSGFTDSALFAL
jgi:hypothetical protein